jgi:hypothetical protein
MTDATCERKLRCEPIDAYEIRHPDGHVGDALLLALSAAQFPKSTARVGPRVTARNE